MAYYDWVLGPDGPSPKPDPEVLDDDEALDAYIEAWKDKITKPATNKSNSKSFNLA